MRARVALVAPLALATPSSSQLTVANASGSVLLAVGADRAWQLPWAPSLEGTFALSAPRIETLCQGATASSWAGLVILGEGFSSPGCSYESRATAAGGAGAAGIVFSGREHNPFDSDGSTRSAADSGRAAAALLDAKIYSELLEPMVKRHPPGSLTLTIAPPGRTPLTEASFAAAQWAGVALILAAVAVNLVAAALQLLWRFRSARMELSTRMVVSLELLSQVFLLLRTLDGPGYDRTHAAITPNWLYRLTLSLYQDLHMLAMMLVSKQLRRTIEQIEGMQATSWAAEMEVRMEAKAATRQISKLSRSSSGLGEVSRAVELGIVSCCLATCRLARRRHDLLVAFVLLVVLTDVVVAALDGAFLLDPVASLVVTLVQTLFFGCMGGYYLVSAARITRLMAATSKLFGDETSSTKLRVSQFSRNVKRAGVLLISCFIAMVVGLLTLVIFDGGGVTHYYVVPTCVVSVFFLMQVCAYCTPSPHRDTHPADTSLPSTAQAMQAFAIIISYKAAKPKQQRVRTSSLAAFSRASATSVTSISVSVCGPAARNAQPALRRPSGIQAADSPLAIDSPMSSGLGSGPGQSSAGQRGSRFAPTPAPEEAAASEAGPALPPAPPPVDVPPDESRPTGLAGIRVTRSRDPAWSPGSPQLAAALERVRSFSSRVGSGLSADTFDLFDDLPPKLPPAPATK